MLNIYSLLLFLFIVVASGCTEKTQESIPELLAESPSIEGKKEYAGTPYVTPGNRVYAVGLQDGSFAEIGWHIKGEMGGVWNHPIKLMDGFELAIISGTEEISFPKAEKFTNFPFANRFGYSLKDQNLSVERWQFVPDDKQGMLIQLVIKNESDQSKDFKLAFTGHTDLMPTWLGERTNMIDKPDVPIYDDVEDIWIVKDSLNPWYAIYGADQSSIAHNNAKKQQRGNGVSNDLIYQIELDGKGVSIINFIVAGSYSNLADAMSTYTDLKQNFLQEFKAKKARYEKLANNSKLTIPDKKMEQTFEWLKYNCDWLVRTVPEVGTGIAAGIPDYPWWFGVDSEYALKGYMAIGQKETALKTISLIDSLSRRTNSNGRIIHETSTNGAVFNKGNINETPQFASLIWETYQWTGDKEFLKKYFPNIKKGLRWLLEEKDANKNLYPDGFGMMEIHGLNSEMIDVAAYTQRAFYDAAKIASELGEEEVSDKYAKIAAELKRKINEEFWSEEFQSFADFIGTDEQALHLIADAIIRADTLNKPWAVEELENTRKAILANPSAKERPFVLHHNWVVNTPMEMNIATPEKALKALQTAEKFVNPFGVFVTGIDRDASAGSDDGSFKGSKVFSYTGAVMTLPTSVQAVAESNYGRSDQALNYLKRMTRTFSYALPGSMYEVSPDYGMITQAWNIYGFAVPIVQQFFGIQPMSYKKKIVIEPQMPAEWANASIENVKVADNEISVFYDEKDGSVNLKVDQNLSDWTVEFVFPKSEFDGLSDAGNFTVIDSTENWVYQFKGAHIDFTLQKK